MKKINFLQPQSKWHVSLSEEKRQKCICGVMKTGDLLEKKLDKLAWLESGIYDSILLISREEYVAIE